jgi:toxin ParE1/3/4
VVSRPTVTRFDHIEADSPQAAITVDGRIRVQVEGLMQFPESGRPGRIEGTRELVILRTPYIAAYRITGDTVRILRLLHGARQFLSFQSKAQQQILEPGIAAQRVKHRVHFDLHDRVRMLRIHLLEQFEGPLFLACARISDQ